MEPDISLYTRQIETLCALAERQEMKLRPEQIREAFEASEVDTDCMLAVLRKLNEKGIRMETVISTEKTAKGQSVQPESGRLSENGVTLVPLTEQDRRRRSYKKRAAALGDVRLFINTVEKAVKVMKLAGVNAETQKKSDSDYIEYTIRIPKTK